MTLQSIMVCPYCRVQNRCPPQYDPQELKCGKCKKPLSGQVDTSCPECGRSFSANPGDVYCPSCAHNFEIDEDGMVLANYDRGGDADDVPPDDSIEITCPSCDETFEDEAPGQVTCPHCGSDFEVDEDGDVVDAEEDKESEGIELELTCPKCGNRWGDDVPGVVVCTRCEYLFYVNEEGGPVGGPNGYICPHCGVNAKLESGKEARGFNCGGCRRALVPRETDYRCPHCGADNYLTAGMILQKYRATTAKNF